MGGSSFGANTTFRGLLANEMGVDFSLGPNEEGDLVVLVEDCGYIFAVETAKDADGDGKPDFLGLLGVPNDSVSVASAAAVGGVISAAVGGAIAASVTAAIGTSIAAGLTAGAAAGAAGGAAGGAAASAAGGAAGGALTPLIMQAQFLGIAGQIGGPSALPGSGMFPPCGATHALIFGTMDLDMTAENLSSIRYFGRP